jgi:hypothetical protein
MAHRRINYEAVFLLPEPLFSLLKDQADIISEKAVNPDKRRFGVKNEAEKHYIDLDKFVTHIDSIQQVYPVKWKDAKLKFTEDTLRAYGIAPYSTYWEFNNLVEIFTSKDKEKIISQMADLGHYISDLHVPLHTTLNYNGQLSKQKGIHGFWETRVPEVTIENYNLLISDRLVIIENPQQFFWDIATESHSFVEETFSLELELTDSVGRSYKEVSSSLNKSGKVYSESYSQLFFEKSGRLQEARMRASILKVAEAWYSAWILAGQPDF